MASSVLVEPLQELLDVAQLLRVARRMPLAEINRLTRTAAAWGQLFLLSEMLRLNNATLCRFDSERGVHNANRSR